jgi:hypothetical protein
MHLFYDMQSKFQNKVVLSKNMWSPFYNSPEHTFSSTFIIQIFINLDKGSFPISLN